MHKIKIVTDSSVALTPEEIVRYHIEVVPLQISMDGKSFLDGIDITKTEIMDMLENSTTIPQTSQPAIGSFLTTYNNIFNESPDTKIISIHLSSALSGTYETAVQAGKLAQGNVTVIDSRQADRPLGILVIRAAQLAEQGIDLKHIQDEIIELSENTKIFVSVMNVHNLIVSGRLTRAQSIISELVNIKLGFVLKEGEISVMNRGRGVKTISKFYDNVISEMNRWESIDQIALSHAKASVAVDEMKKKLGSIFPSPNIIVFN